jgi:biotin carboxyl carrier protein
MSVGRKLELEIDGQRFQVQVEELESERAKVKVNGQTVEVAIRAPGAKAAQAATRAPAKPAAVTPAKPAQAAKPVRQSSNQLCAMMPGVITSLLVEPGQQVEVGQVLLVLEAMKMENEIRSDRQGSIERLEVSAGQQVQTGDVMLVFA